MHSLLITIFSIIGQNRRFSFNKILLNLCKTLAISALIIFISFIFLANIWNPKASKFFFFPQNKWLISQTLNSTPPTNITHIVFGISGSMKSWTQRKNYIESWWKPNVTRGYLFLDKNPTLEFFPWPSSSPPFKVSEDTTKFQVFKKHVAPSVIRIARAILETFRAEDGNKNVRWYVMGDDDTIFFVDNLVRVLGSYDHTKYFYIGGISECTKSNYDFSFEMAFGGGGFVLSRPLAAALVANLDYCIERYWYMTVSDQILQSCIADIGVSLTPEKGFHQVIIML